MLRLKKLCICCCILYMDHGLFCIFARFIWAVLCMECHVFYILVEMILVVLLCMCKYGVFYILIPLICSCFFNIMYVGMYGFLYTLVQLVKMTWFILHCRHYSNLQSLILRFESFTLVKHGPMLFVIRTYTFIGVMLGCILSESREVDMMLWKMHLLEFWEVCFLDFENVLGRMYLWFWEWMWWIY